MIMKSLYMQLVEDADKAIADPRATEEEKVKACTAWANAWSMLGESGRKIADEQERQAIANKSCGSL
jgi:hypothetical protein